MKYEQREATGTQPIWWAGYEIGADQSKLLKTYNIQFILGTFRKSSVFTALFAQKIVHGAQKNVHQNPFQF